MVIYGTINKSAAEYYILRATHVPFVEKHYIYLYARRRRRTTQYYIIFNLFHFENDPSRPPIFVKGEFKHYYLKYQ